MKKILTMIIIFITIFVGVPVNAADACYQCNGKSNVYKWGSNGDADSSCPSGYHSVSLTETQCKTKMNSTNSCYQCNGSSNVYKWGSNSDADSSCPSGYHSVSLTETQCKSKKNSSTTGKTITCAGADNIPAALPKFLSNIVNLLKIVTPIILIIMGMLDFAKASMSGEDKSINESKSKFMKRLIAALAVFLVITILQILFRLINTEDTNSMAACINCFLNGDCDGISELPRIYGCTEIKTKEECNGFAPNGDVCSWYNNKCIRAKDVPDNSGCRKYTTEASCPNRLNDIKCKWDDEESWCSYAGKAQKCSDYKLRSSCDGQNDDYGNVCMWSNGKCSNDNRNKCSDYKTETECPITLKTGKKCTWTNNSCTEVTSTPCSQFKTKSTCKNTDKVVCTWNSKISECVQTGELKNCSKWKSQEDCETFEDDYGNACEWVYGEGCKNV